MNDRFKFRAWIGKERALIGYGARYLYFNAIGGISDSLLKKEGFDEIEQCTGLKDKNGKLIYEGDIVLKSDGDIYEVFWDEKMLGFYLQDKIVETVLYKGDVEVIGNIHENADLLENEE